MWDKKRKVIDGLAVIEEIIIHHTAGAQLRDMSDYTVRTVLNKIGFDRGYRGYEYDFKTGYSKTWGQNFKKLSDSGEIGYAEYHYTIHPYNGGYRLVQLLDDPMFVDAGSTGSRDHNSQAIAVSFCGNFEDNNAPESMIKFFIDLFLPGGALRWILEKNSLINVLGHKDIDSTLCPGRYLYPHIPRIEKEIRSLI